MPLLWHRTLNRIISYVARAKEAGSERMEKNKALELLKQALDEVPKLRTLPPDRQQYLPETFALSGDPYFSRQARTF